MKTFNANIKGVALFSYVNGSTVQAGGAYEHDKVV